MGCRFPDYVPPSVPWEMTEVINSLITYSLYLLKPGGRLVFFLPTDNVSGGRPTAVSHGEAVAAPVCLQGRKKLTAVLGCRCFQSEYKDVDIPVVPGLRLISNSSEDFGKWARRLITMEVSLGDPPTAPALPLRSPRLA